MPHADTEDQLVEPLAIALFASLGWQTVLVLEKRYLASSAVLLPERFIYEL